MPTGVEYREALLRLHAALSHWHTMDNTLSQTRTGNPHWGEICKSHSRACRELHDAYTVVMMSIVGELEEQWGGKPDGR